MTPERQERLKKVAAHRQLDLTVVLENVHDPHNIGAVLRSCDSVGIPEVFILYSDPQLDADRLRLGKKSSSGARKWLKINYYTDPEDCFGKVSRRYRHILGTHLSDDAENLYDLDLTGSLALVFGNEHEGISQAALKYCHGNFLIPQMGMVRSLNISVACAVSLYEACRQRMVVGKYDRPFSEGHEALFEEYVRRHEKRSTSFSIPRKND